MPAGRSRRLWIVNGAIVVLVLLAAGGTVAGLTLRSSSSDASLRTTPVGRGTVAETVSAAATVTSATSATLNFSSSGRIADVRVRLGDRVTQGQTVARLDGEYAQASLTAADAQVSAAEQQLDDAHYQQDHPQSTQQQSGTGATSAAQPKAGSAAGSGTTTGTTGATTGTTGSPTGSTTAGSGSTTTSGQQQGGLVTINRFSSSGSGVEQVRPMADQTTGGGTGGTTGGSTGTGSTGTGSTGTGSTAGSSGTTAQTSEDPGEAAVRNAESQLAQAKATRVQAFQNTQNLDLVAPTDGTVVSLDGIEGQLAGPQGVVVSQTGTGNPAGGRLPDGSAISSGAGSGQSATSGASSASGAAGGAGSGAASNATAAQTAPAVMTIADLGAMQVLAQVPELDVGKVATGQTVAVSVNALQGRKLPGTVVSINMLPGSQSTVQYGTAVAITAPPPGLRPGMSASVSITTQQANDVTFLPSVAVTPVGGADSGQGTVQVLQPDGTTAQRTIGTGLASDTVTQVTSGLSLGDLVVLPDQSASSAASLRGLRGGGGGAGGGGTGGGAGR